MNGMQLSVVIPTLNEERRLGLRLQELLQDPHVQHIVVADGGSDDQTRAVFYAHKVNDLQDRLVWVAAPRGRARQMNAGAQAVAATTDVFLFLHADVQLPQGFAKSLLQALLDPQVVAGAFRTWTVDDRAAPDRRWWSPLLHLADLRSRTSRLPYGDQALFVRQPVFARLGGFPDQPLMEDLELSRRLLRQGRVVVLAASVHVSGRRFLQRPLYYTFVVNVFPALYRLGVSPANLEKLYKAVR